MAGAAPAAAAAATASEHTRGTLVWVRPAAAAGKTTASADAEEWVKATVARVLAGGATLEVVLEGSSNEEESTTTISVPAADAPLQNPASRLGVEVRRERLEGDGIGRATPRRSSNEARRAFFSLERRERTLAAFKLVSLLWAA